jgi:hypothetical protein
VRAGRQQHATHEPLISPIMVEEVPLAGLFFCLLNHQEQLPAIPVEKISFKLCPVKGETFAGLTIGPQQEAHPYSIDEHGCLTATLERLTDLTMFHAAYDKAEGV